MKVYVDVCSSVGNIQLCRAAILHMQQAKALIFVLAEAINATKIHLSFSNRC